MLLDGLADVVGWILSFFFGELPERPRWLRRLVAAIYLLLFVVAVAALINVLT